jgi:FkbM family methyltransferase
LDFFVATAQAADWYDPPQKYVLLEYEWVAENIPMEGKNVVDGGCHHGHYAMVFGMIDPDRLTLVDVHESNLDVTEVNMRLNVNDFDRDFGLIHGALWNEKGKVKYDGHSNGALMVDQPGGIEVDAFRLEDIDPEVQVVKLDIEGAEYVVIPQVIESGMNVESWIVEFHAGHNIPQAPDITANHLKEAGYELHWVNRNKMEVEPYQIGTEWTTHSTVFARR